MEYQPIERELMAALLAGDDPVLEALRAQYAVAVITKRDFTGSGFFIYFSVPPDAPRLAHSPHRVDDVVFTLCSDPAGGDAILWLKEGALDSLEACAHDGVWPDDAQLDSVSYFSGAERDLNWLRASWGG